MPIMRGIPPDRPQCEQGRCAHTEPACRTNHRANGGRCEHGATTPTLVTAGAPPNAKGVPSGARPHLHNTRRHPIYATRAACALELSRPTRPNTRLRARRAGVATTRARARRPDCAKGSTQRREPPRWLESTTTRHWRAATGATTVPPTDNNIKRKHRKRNGRSIISSRRTLNNRCNTCSNIGILSNSKRSME